MVVRPGPEPTTQRGKRLAELTEPCVDYSDLDLDPSVQPPWAHQKESFEKYADRRAFSFEWDAHTSLPGIATKCHDEEKSSIIDGLDLSNTLLID